MLGGFQQLFCASCFFNLSQILTKYNFIYAASPEFWNERHALFWC